MDKYGHIYELTAEEQAAALKDLREVTEAEQEKVAALREDVARLDGYLKARAEADAPKRERPNSDLTRRRSDG